MLSLHVTYRIETVLQTLQARLDENKRQNWTQARVLLFGSTAIFQLLHNRPWTPSVLTISKSENCDAFLASIFDSLTPWTPFISLWGVSKVHFSFPLVIFYASTIPLSDHFVTEELGIGSSNAHQKSCSNSLKSVNSGSNVSSVIPVA